MYTWLSILKKFLLRPKFNATSLLILYLKRWSNDSFIVAIKSSFANSIAEGDSVLRLFQQ